ncbi:MAG TPA: SMP-30/gluconolactonase/LRE family protein [Caldilineaceae bacterium]|nr:SMP-30/gluconolactonase/LRE family protein [Caldilineaceae bacterium]
MEPELIADYQCVTGEGPLWHPTEQRVYWTDIPTGRMFRYDPKTGHHEQFYSGDVVGGFTIQDDGALLLFQARGAVKIWRDGKLETILEEIPDERETRFNDVFADPEGRVFCGTMPTKERKGRLYRLDPDRTLTLLLEGIGISNGMGLTPDRRQLYYTDSAAKQIYLFDYDQATGAISNQRVFVDSRDEEGVPDGMTVDAEGYVWSARWDGSCLIRYTPDGREERRIHFPAKKVSSVIFGGPDYTDMYVTTAGGNDKATNGPGAGALFRLRLGIRGTPEFPSRIR